MATISNETTINRDSVNTSLADRYMAGQTAGGAYSPVQKTVKTEGSNELSVGGSTFDSNYTVTKGFKIDAKMGQTELKDAVDGTQSKGMSRYIKGFNNNKYTDGKFTR